MHWFVFIFLSILFLITPYFKGLYFDTDIYSIHMLIGVLFLLMLSRLIFKKEINELKSAYIVLLLPASYLLSFFIAESPKGAIDSLLRWITYSAFFLMLYWVSLRSKINRLLPLVFHVTGIWITVFMLAAYYGLFEYRNSLILGRFSSIFQYPNTYAMIVAVFLLFALMNLTKDRITLVSATLYSFPIIAYMVCFIQSYSRGMILVFPLVWFIGLMLLSMKKQIRYFLFSTAATILSAVVYLSMSKGQIEGHKYPGLLALIVVTFVFIALIILVNKYAVRRKYSDRILLFTKAKYMRFFLPSIIVFILLGGFLDIKFEGLVYQQLPEKLQERVSDLDIHSSTAKERIIFFRDSIKISQDSPLIGFGGQSWEVLYKKYQTLPYQSNKAHNGYLEWLLDTGIIGLLLLVIVVSYFFAHLFLKYRTARDHSLPVAAITGLLTILLHSFVDFNFSYGTVWFIFLWLLVIGMKTYQEKPAEEKKIYKTSKPLLTCLSCFSILVILNIITSYRFMNANQFYNESKESNNPAEKQYLVERAVQYDPKNTHYLLQLAKIYASQTKNPEYESKLHPLIKNITDIEPNNSTNLINAALLSEKTKNYDQAISYYTQALKVDHFNAKLYEKSIALKTKKAIEMYKLNLHKEMNVYIKSAQEDYEKNLNWYKYYEKIPIKNKKAHNSRDFEVSDRTKYLIAFTHFVNKELDESLSMLKEINKLENKELATKILTLKVLTLERKGLKQEANTLLKENNHEYRNLAPSIQKFRETF
jgi:tetratricopeptide (TPR) repeat protein